MCHCLMISSAVVISMYGMASRRFYVTRGWNDITFLQPLGCTDWSINHVG